MLSTTCDTHQTDSHRNALYLAEQCLRKYGGMRSEIAPRFGLTAAERERLTSSGAMRVVRQPSPVKHFQKVQTNQAYGMSAIYARRWLDMPEGSRPRVTEYANSLGISAGTLHSQITVEARFRTNRANVANRKRIEKWAGVWLDSNPEDAQGLFGYDEDRKRQFARRQFAEKHGFTNNAFAHAINRVRLMRQIDKP